MTTTDRPLVVITGLLFRENDRVINRIRDILGDIAEVVEREVDTPAEMMRLLQPASVLMTDVAYVDAGLIEALPNLRAIVVMGVGTDRIDTDAARRHGIVVSNTPDSFTQPVAEHTIALLLAVMRNVAVAHHDVRTSQRWDTYGQSHKPVAISGKTLGLVGFGRIGRGVARIALGLGLSLLAYDPAIVPASPIAETFPSVCFTGSLADVLARADAVSLHVPLTEATRGLIGQEQFALMKRGAYLVNVSRGELVDHGALRLAMTSGHLAGAAVDVFVPEPPHWDDPLLHQRNLVITPHIAYLSETSLVQCQLDAAAEVHRLLLGEPPRNRVA